MDAITFRGVERLVICAGGIVFGYLGYRRFVFGAEKGSPLFKTESKMFKLMFSGTAPGLFFMFGGAAILVCALLFGGAERKDPKYEILKHETWLGVFK